jgi:carbamate kinase
MSQGYIGFHLVNALKTLSHQKATTVITRCLVDHNDPGFRNPSKPIGSFYTAEQAQAFGKETGFEFKEDSGRGWRRVVASPKPIAILEIDTIKQLLQQNQIVIAGGGGGIPVMESTPAVKLNNVASSDSTSTDTASTSSTPVSSAATFTASTAVAPATPPSTAPVTPDATPIATSASDTPLIRADAVIDKDFCAELIAEQIGADYLFILTAVEKVALNFGKPNQSELGEVKVSDLETYLEAGHFAAGSMLPKVQAGLKFVKSGRGNAVITSLDAAPKALVNQAGTRIVPD